MKRLFSLSLLAVVLFSINSCYTPTQARRVGFASVNNNVCKRLTGKVVLYGIFVDSKYTNPWSKYDIESTMDSIKNAMAWIESKAIEDSILLNIEFDYHQTPQGRVPIKADLTKKTLSSTLYKTPQWSGVRDIHRWADKIAKEAGKALPKDESPMTNIKNDLKTRERLIARLRDIHRTDKVALIYFINNYYKDEISVAFDVSNDNSVEYAVVSFKNPSVIAHEFLHLFGAYDLYLTPFDTKKKDKKKKEKLVEMFPDEIMAYAHRNIDSLQISGFTKYLIGWDNELSQEYQELLWGKDYFAVKY
jgi:hypothetical protein